MTVGTLEGTLVRWARIKPSGWGIGDVRTADETVKVVGVIEGAREGDWLELTGEHEHHSRGPQFRVTAAVLAVPRSDEAVVAWLRATLPTIGYARATTMIKHFGGADALWRVLEHEPARLTEVAGITPARAALVVEAYHATRATRDDQIALRGWGLTANQIARCVATWGSVTRAVMAIRGDPYELYRQVPGFGFLTADKVARATGLALDAPERIRAALTYVLEQHTQEGGHVYMLAGHYHRAVWQLLELPPRTVLVQLERAIKRGEVVRRGARVYSARLDNYEAELAQYLGRRGVST